MLFPAPRVFLIVAHTEDHVIGTPDRIPWHLPADLAWFRRITWNRTVLIGGRTWRAMGKRVLPNRTLLVLSRKEKVSCVSLEGGSVRIIRTLEEALNYVQEKEEHILMVAGGGEIYRMCWERADGIFRTRIRVHSRVLMEEKEERVRFPEISPEEWKCVDRWLRTPDHRNPFMLEFEVWIRKHGDRREKVHG